MHIDGHIHVWPDSIAARALSKPSASLRRVGDGTVAGATQALVRAGIDKAICLAIADTGEHLEGANRFVGSLDRRHFIGFGSVHPSRPVEENVESLRRHGLRGVKVHPLFQGYGLDDPALWSILDALRGEFVIVVHVGGEHAGDTHASASPRSLARIAKNFPDLDIVACHFGGYHAIDEALEHIIGTAIYIDTSWPPTVSQLEQVQLRTIIERHGPDRVLFASDWPMANPELELAAIEDLRLGDRDTDAILGGNYARLLGLET
jgi:uncharacterized protein